MSIYILGLMSTDDSTALWCHCRATGIICIRRALRNNRLNGRVYAMGLLRNAAVTRARLRLLFISIYFQLDVVMSTMQPLAFVECANGWR